MALGVSENASWQQKILKFSPGDVLVMYTDGITEAHNPQGAFFSESRLQDSLRANQERPADEIVQSVLEQVNSFTRGAPNQDDMALVVMNRRN
jgi:sigma-B regulation protein RsbU (phosphoserine phosphatase)